MIDRHRGAKRRLAIGGIVLAVAMLVGGCADEPPAWPTVAVQPTKTPAPTTAPAKPTEAAKPAAPVAAAPAAASPAAAAAASGGGLFRANEVPTGILLGVNANRPGFAEGPRQFVRRKQHVLRNGAVERAVEGVQFLAPRQVPDGKRAAGLQDPQELGQGGGAVAEVRQNAEAQNQVE